MIGRRISYLDDSSGAAVSSAPTVHIPFCFLLLSTPFSFTKMKFTSTLFAVVAVSASLAAAAPIQERAVKSTTVVGSDCANGTC